MTSTGSVRERLAAAVASGDLLDLLPSTSERVLLDERVMRGWGTDHDLAAEDLFELLHGRGLPDGRAAHPRGVRLRGARITGRLILDFVTDALPLELVDCLLDDGINAYAARLPYLELRRCRITRSTGIPLDAENAHIDHDLRVVHSVITAPNSAHCTVDLTGARIDHTLTFQGSTLHHESRPALYADGCSTGGSVFLTGGFRARGAGQSGAVCLVEARITGVLSAVGAVLINDSGPALIADGCSTGGSVFLIDGFRARGAGRSGAVRLVGAQIAGVLGAGGAILTNESGPALIADRCCTGGGVFLTGGFRARGAGQSGAVRLLGARIAGQLNAGGAILTNDSGPALHADRCSTGGDMVLASGFHARGAGQSGAVRLPGARIAGQLNAGGAILTNDSGPALHADGCSTGDGVFLPGGFRAHGAGENGAVRLSGAQITGQLYAEGAVLTNGSGPALTADGCSISDAVFFTGGFRAHGAGQDGALRLIGARIAGQLNAEGAILTNGSGPALTADGCSISDAVFFTGGFRAHGAGEDSAVRLNGARITRQLSFRDATLTSTAPEALNLYSAQVGGPLLLDGTFNARGMGTRRGIVVDLTDAQLGSLAVNDKQSDYLPSPIWRWELDGCTYTGIPSPDDPNRWRTLLRDVTPGYAAQPYQQLAAVYRAAGHDRDVREILIAQRRDQIHRGRLTWRQKNWTRFTGAVLGFGWKPWRALWGLAATSAVSVVLAVGLGGHGALVHPPQPGQPAQACTLIERAGVGLDLGTPLLSSAAKSRDRCPINPDPASVTATALIVSTWVLQLIAWGLAALFVAGFTGAVRKT